ncbi:BlaI/MecI/CopY family transcriptional regulator [Streptomyces longwoodensis]|uniref:BlaI/MecI/CopY family transcriptional regulator n=1 Tax=Streptomyces longwoodensis TaxID=68231 RepID=UPI00339F5334
MSENTTATTELASQYASQVTTDLERNVQEQARLSAEIAALQEQLTTLQHDHTVLVNLQQALGLAPSAPAGPTTTPTVPAPRKKTAAATETPKKPQAKKTSAAAGRAKSTKSAASRATAAGAKSATPPAGKTAKAATKTAKAATKAAKSAKAPASAAPTAGKSAKSPASTPAESHKPAAAPADRPTLVDLVREHLAEQSEPRSAAEIATTLGRAHTDRAVKPTVVRTTLEALVAKGQAQRTRQGRSVFYTAPDAPEQQSGQTGQAAQPDLTDRTPAASDSRSEDAA